MRWALKKIKQSGSAAWWLVATLLLGAHDAALAENIDPSDNGAQYAWGEHIGWLNAEPQGDGAMGVTVRDSQLTGWIWSENHGWISLSCQNTSSCGDNDYGVINDGKGNLSGFAWGEHLGWVNFRTDTGSDCCSASGTPGCTDQVCETTMCGLDPYCCNTEWDDLCAISAELEPDCVPGCADDPWGVRVHGFTGNFSGFAWSEHHGWINFGSAPPKQTHQIEAEWRCPDPDADGVCSASDSCPGLPNPDQEAVPFGQTVRAASNGIGFVWSAPVAWRVARGTFSASVSIGDYVVDFFDQGEGNAYTDPALPAINHSGFWYMFRPDCPAGSYSTGAGSQQGDRDGAMLP